MSVQDEVKEIISIFKDTFPKKPMKDTDENTTTIAWLDPNYQAQMQLKGNGHAAIFMENIALNSCFYITDIAISEIQNNTKLWDFIKTLTTE